ncbi:hypothetical protein pEaSNUABM29_00206 [Erwinia phage pEa_SNUABM_29]|nr:hypothetical protein pEaSNUABM29_00206 [Erwinia phage pEa_SNUABM_29]
MQLPNAQVQIYAVNGWYHDARVFEHGDYSLQRSKIYRCFGDVSHGVQKSDNLQVAAGIGSLIWAYFGLIQFSLKGREIDLTHALDHNIALKTKPSNKHQMLHAVALNMMDLLSNTEETEAIDYYSFLQSFNGFLTALNGLARSCGLEFDRVVYNGHRALIAKKGEMNEFGMFMPAPDSVKRDGSIGDFAGDIYASGATTRFYIESALSQCLASSLERYKHAPFDESKLDDINRKVNDAIDQAMEKYIRHDTKWHGLLFERVPAIAVSYSDGTIAAKMNEDLLFIINELKKDL